MTGSLLAVFRQLERFPLSIIQLAMRIGVGAVFFKAGLLKYNSWEFTIQLFRDEYKVPVLDPVVAAQMATVQELTIPVLLFVGLATRIATVPLLGMIAVIQTFVYPNAWTEHLVWGSILVLLLTRGPGVFSLDYLVARRFSAAGASANASATRSPSRIRKPDGLVEGPGAGHEERDGHGDGTTRGGGRTRVSSAVG